MSVSQPRPRPRLLPKLIFGLIALAVIILIGRRVPGGVLGMAEADLARLAVLVAVLLFLIGALLGGPMTAGQVIRSTIVWALLILLAAGLYASRDQLAGFAGRLVGALAPGVPVSGSLTGEADPQSVVIMRAMDGHFAVRAKIGDDPIALMVDTGASFVTLTYDDAKRLGFEPDGLAYDIPIRTANGTITAAPILLDRIAVGPIERQGVRALVAPRGVLDQSLLGLTFLNTLNSYSVGGDRLVLTP